MNGSTIPASVTSRNGLTGDRSAVITLNRPRVLNALSRALKGELSDALTRIKADPGIRAVIMRA